MGSALSTKTGAASYSLREFLLYFVRLWTVGFGGPIALAARMEKDLVEERRWISRQDYVEGLAFSQLSPGPLAAQLALYLGWVRAGRFSTAIVGVAFILSSLLMAVGLAAVYVYFGRLSWIQGMFYGIGAAVIAIVAQSAFRLARKTLGKDLFLWLLLAIVAITTVWTGSEFVAVCFVRGDFCCGQGATGVPVKAGSPIDRRRFRLAAHQRARECFDGSLMEHIERRRLI